MPSRSRSRRRRRRPNGTRDANRPGGASCYYPPALFGISNNRPGSFYGQHGEDVEAFLAKFDYAAYANRWSDRRKAELLPLYLMREAADFWDGLDSCTRYDYQKATTALRAHFPPKENQELTTDDRFEFQTPGESVEEFARTIVKLTLLASGHMSIEDQTWIMREHFINGLRPSLRQVVMSNDPATFAEALRVATVEERSQGQDTGVPGRNRRTINGVPICNRCNKIGHERRRCPMEAALDELLDSYDFKEPLQPLRDYFKSDSDDPRPSTSPWSAPVVKVQHPDGTVSYCYDYRNVKMNSNEVCVRPLPPVEDTFEGALKMAPYFPSSHRASGSRQAKDAPANREMTAIVSPDQPRERAGTETVRPLPRLYDNLNVLGKAPNFPTMHFAPGGRHTGVFVPPVDREKTAVVSYSRVCELDVMPFGLLNEPSTFQRRVALLLAGLPWKTCRAYQDDVVTSSKSRREHQHHLCEVFNRFPVSGLQLNWRFHHSEAEIYHMYLGNAVRLDGDGPKRKAIAIFSRAKYAGIL